MLCAALERTAATAAGTIVAAIAGQLSLVARMSPLQRAAQRDLLPRAGVPVAQPALPEAQVSTGRRPAAAATLAVDLGASHYPAGIVIAGTPICMDALTVGKITEHASIVVAQVDMHRLKS